MTENLGKSLSGAQCTAHGKDVEWKDFELILTSSVFWNNNPLWQNFQNFVSKVFTDLPIDVAMFKCLKICLTWNRWNSALFAWQKIRPPLKLSLLRESRPKSTRASPQHLAHNVPNFIQITFGGVIAKRVKAVLVSHTVFSRFAIRGE